MEVVGVVDSIEGKAERYKGVKGFKNRTQDLLTSKALDN